MKFDRTYWRDQSAERLIEEARDSGDELTIALGERLAIKDERLVQARAQTKAESEYLATIDVMRAEIAALERQVRDLSRDGMRLWTE